MPQKPTRLTAEEVSLLFRGATPEGQFSGDPNAPNFSGPPEPEQQFTDPLAPNFGRPPPPPGLLAAIEEQKAFAGREEFLNSDAYRDTGTPSLFSGQRIIPDEVLNDPDFKRHAGPTLTGLIPPVGGAIGGAIGSLGGPFPAAIGYGTGAILGSGIKVAADEHILGIDPNDNNFLKNYVGSTGNAVADSALEEIVFEGAPKILGKAAGALSRTRTAQRLADNFSAAAKEGQEFLKEKGAPFFRTTAGGGESKKLGSKIITTLETLFQRDRLEAIKVVNTEGLATALKVAFDLPPNVVGNSAGQAVLGNIAKKQSLEVLGAAYKAKDDLYALAEGPVLHPSNTIQRRLSGGAVEIIEGPIDMSSVIGKLDVLRGEAQARIRSSTPLPAAQKKQLTALLLDLDDMISPKGILPDGQPDFRHGYFPVKDLRTGLREGIPDETNIYGRFNKQFVKILGEGLEDGFAKLGGNVEDLRAANAANKKLGDTWSLAKEDSVKEIIRSGKLPESAEAFLNSAKKNSSEAKRYIDMLGGDKKTLQAEIIRNAFSDSVQAAKEITNKGVVQAAIPDSDIIQGVASGIKETNVIPVNPQDVLLSLKKNALYTEAFSPKKQKDMENLLRLAIESNPVISDGFTSSLQILGGRVFVYGTLATLGGLVGAAGGEGYIDGGPIRRAAVGAGGLVVIGMGLDNFSSFLVDDQSAKFVRGLINAPAKSAGTGRKIAGLLASKPGQTIRFSVSVVDPATKQVTPISIGEQAKRNNQGSDSVRLDPQDVDAMFSGTASGDNF